MAKQMTEEEYQAAKKIWLKFIAIGFFFFLLFSGIIVYMLYSHYS